MWQSNEKITDKPRYMYELADYCNVSKSTLRNWVRVSPYAYLLKRKQNLLSPKEIKLLLEHLGYDIK